MAKQKINWILILQAWAMAWVVVGHAPLLDVKTEIQPAYVNYLYKIAYSFHMPLFIMVSGYLFQMTRIEIKMPYVKMILDKLMRLGIPMMVFTALAMVMKTLFSADMARQTSISLSTFIKAMLYPAQGPLNEMWFIAVILWMFVLRPLWEFTLRKPVYIAATLLLLLSLHFAPIPKISLLCISKAINMAIFFYIGIILRYYSANQAFTYGGGGICLPL